MRSPELAPPRPPRQDLPRWAWAMMFLLLLIAIVAAAVAMYAVQRDEPAEGPPSTNPSASPVKPSGASSPATPPARSVTVADGCLGGASELDEAILNAQLQAPLSRVGAATFTASLVRWSFAGPPPPVQEKIADQILARRASRAARNSLSSTKDLQGSSGTIDFADGLYYVEAFTERTATVSYLGTGHLADKGTPQPDVLLSGSVHLRAVDGVWRYQDLSQDRSIEDLQRIGIPYAGGC